MIARSSLAIIALAAASAAAGQTPPPAPAPQIQSGVAPNQAGAGQGRPDEGPQSTSDFAQEATRPGSLFPAWSMKSTRPIDARLQPNVGIRARGSFSPIRNGPLLFPNYSALQPDFLGGQTTMPWSLRASITLLGVDRERESSKLHEYRDMRDGTVTGMDARYRNGNAFFSLLGRQLGRTDQDLAMEGGVAGAVTWSALYDETPHNYAFDAKTLFAGVGTNRLTIADQIQTDLQNTPSNLELGAKAAAYVAQQATSVDLSLRRQKVGGDITLLATYPWVFKGSFSNESRDGERPWSASFGFGSFHEIPWPVQYDTREARLTAERAKPESRFVVSASYRYSDFVDHVDSLLFDNPFRITDAPNPGIGSPLLGPATGRMSMYPSNRYQEGSGSFTIKQLPLKSTINGLVSLGYFRQNDPLLPFSTNTAVVDTLSSPTKASFLATDPSGLPRATAETAMDSQTVQLRWTGELSKALRLVGQYRAYRLVNNEEPFRTNMFVREDQDRRLPETVGGTYLTVPADYARQTATAEVSYNFSRDSRFNGAFTLERLDLDHREIEWANDRKLKAAFDSRWFGWLEFKTWYENSERTTSLYEFDQYNIYQGNPLGWPMLPWLLKFDESPFTRHEGQVMATAFLNDALSLSAHAQVVSTNFHQVELGPLSKAASGVTAPMDPNNQFGVRFDRKYSVGADLSYAPSERYSVFVDGGIDEWRYEQGARQWTVNGLTDPYRRQTTTESASNWVANPRDKTWTGGLGGDAELVPDRLHVQVQFTYSRSDGQQRYSSPLGTPDVNAFTPTPFEDVDDIRWRTVNGELEWKFARALSLAGGYHYEKWEIDDYSYKGFTLTPVYNNGVAILMGGLLPPGFNTNVAYVRVRAGF